MDRDTEIIYRCFEQVADSGVDLAPRVYDKFVEAMPDADQHIGYMDSRMRGRMLDQIYKLLLDDTEGNYLEFETRTHRGYGADSPLYRGILVALKETVRDCLEGRWSPEDESAWDRSIKRILGEIDSLNPVSEALQA
jgi:hypothetical protein